MNIPINPDEAVQEIKTPVKFETSDASIRDADNKPICHFAQTRPYALSSDENAAKYIAKVLNEHASLVAQVEKANEAKLMLEDMFRVDARLTPEYEKGWNEAISNAIEKFGPNTWAQEREEMLDELNAKDAQVEKYKTALEYYANKENWYPFKLPVGTAHGYELADKALQEKP